MSEKLDPLKLAEELEAQLGPKMEQMLKEDAEKSKNNGADLGALAEKGLKNEGADLNVKLNPSQPPFTKREEKGAGAEKFVVPETLGASEKSRIELMNELMDLVEEKSPLTPPKGGEKEELRAEREKSEAALAKAREDYVAAVFTKERADKGVEKLDSVWAKIKDFAKYHPTGETVSERAQRKGEQAGGVIAEKAQAYDNLLAAQKAMKDALKNYRGQAVNEKTSELNASGKLEEEIRKEMEKFAKDLVLATTVREAAKIDSLKSDKQIEQMGAARQFINEKAEEFTEWYKKQPLKYKIAVSAGLGVGGAAGALTGLTQVVSFALAGQIGLRVLGSAMTTGGLGKAMESSRERLAEKKMAKEFAGKYLEMLKNQNDELDNKIIERLGARKNEKTGRFILAGTMGALVGGGALAQVVRNGFKTEFGQEMVGKLRETAEKTIDWIKHPLSGVFDVDKEVLRTQGENELLKHLPSEAPKSGVPVSIGVISPETAPGVDVAKAGGEILNLKIGSRGPEGAMIDYFKANPEAAEKLAAKMKISLNGKEGIGRLAHGLWLKSVESELHNPKVLEEMIKHGYNGDAEGYAKAMRHIGKGFVELDSQGNIRLSDKTSFLDAPTANEALPVGEQDFSIKPGSEEFYNLQQKMELSHLSSEGRIPAINKMLENANEQLTSAEEHLKQADLTPETKDHWQRQKFSWLTEKERLMDGLKITEDKLPQTIKDLLPPEIIDRSNFGKIMDAGKFSELSGTRKELVDKLYIKYIGRSFDEFNQLPVNLRGEYLDKLNYDIDKIGKSGIMSPANEGNLAHKALMWRNIGEMKHLQEIQEKFANLPKPISGASNVVESLNGQPVRGDLIDAANSKTIKEIFTNNLSPQAQSTLDKIAGYGAGIAGNNSHIDIANKVDAVVGDARNMLVEEVNSGRITVRDFGQYYIKRMAESEWEKNTLSKDLSVKMLDNLESAFKDINGSDNLAKAKAVRVLDSVLHKLIGAK